MRREGRVHGSYVRESKHTPWAVRAPIKPTGHSKGTSNCPSNKLRCKLCVNAPAAKVRENTKGRLKAKAFNITSNYKMSEWRVCNSGPPTTSKKPILKVEHALVACDMFEDFSNDIGDEEDNSDSSNEIEVEEPESWMSGIVLPIESLLRVRKMREVHPAFVSDIPDGESGNETDDSWSCVDSSDGEAVSDGMTDGEEDWADDWCLVEADNM